MSHLQHKTIAACNVLQQGLEGEMTISAFADQQARVNCTVLLAYPSHVEISLREERKEKKAFDAARVLRLKNSFDPFDRLESFKEVSLDAKGYWKFILFRFLIEYIFFIIKYET